MLKGSEVKSLRAGRANIAESYASAEGDEMWLINAYIPPYDPAGRYDSHDPRRKRKLLLHRKQISRLSGLRKQQGITLIPLRLYFNDRGLAKLVISLASGKKQHDKFLLFVFLFVGGTIICNYRFLRFCFCRLKLTERFYLVIF
ncbi:MAG: SsrA-binding protein [Azoarcus sp.]|nr:SsrA-binding protein [Azoarcus sp.]